MSVTALATTYLFYTLKVPLGFSSKIQYYAGADPEPPIRGC